jgi:hypothetical protein
MNDEKVTNKEATNPRRRIELRDIALAAFYPRTQSTTPKPAVTPDVQSLEKRQRDNPSPPEEVAKPWKKPWDK